MAISMTEAECVAATKASKERQPGYQCYWKSSGRKKRRFLYFVMVRALDTWLRIQYWTRRKSAYEYDTTLYLRRWEDV